MGSVTEIWNAHNLKTGLGRYWVRLGEEMLISGDQMARSGVLSIWQTIPGSGLYATLKVAPDELLTGEIVRGEKLVIRIHDLVLVVFVRAVEGTRVLVEFGVPPGIRAKVAFAG